MEELYKEDRVRENTPDKINRKIDRELENTILYFSTRSRKDQSSRIKELESEWDIERTLETNASILGLAGLTLGIIHHKRWLYLPATVLTFLFQHAVQGWCPPVSLFRKMGIRTRKEIEREKYALKALRGDFDLLPDDRKRSSMVLADSALDAVIK